MAIQSVEPRRWHTFNLLDCFVISFLAMTEILARVATADFRPCYIYLSCTASTLVIASVARQSSKNNACAIRRTSIIYYLLSIIYYLLSIIYALNKNPPIRAVFIRIRIPYVVSTDVSFRYVRPLLSNVCAL